MKRLLLLCVLLVFAFPVFAQTICRVQDQRPLQLMSKEINRSMKTFKKQNPPIYYVAYNFDDLDVYGIDVEEKGVTNHTKRHDAMLQVQVRAGSLQMDNTRTLKTGNTYRSLEIADMPAIGEDGRLFRQRCGV